jgi:hypothetical protein
MADQTIRVRTWVKASESDIRTGLLGFLSVHYGDLVLDGLYLISFPARSDRSGRKHPYIRPADDEVRQRVERELLRQLAEREEAAP